MFRQLTSPVIFAALFGIGIFAAAAYAQTATPPVALTIHADHALHAVSPMLYGLMTEEINYSYDGGIYAEMVRNRSFQDHGFGGIAHWNLDNRGSSSSTMTMDSAEGPSSALPSSLRLDIASADASDVAGIRNDGYWGMGVRPDTVYTGSLYARADADHFGAMSVALVNDATGKTLATSALPEISRQWKRYEYKLTTGKVEASGNNHLLITFGRPGKVWLQVVSLFPPTFADRTNGNRADLMEMLADMHPKFLRLPGGNYLEGDKIQERFDWKTTLGPLVDRPTHRGPWRYTSSDGMGLLEFLEWTEDLHMEPVLAVYAGYSLGGDLIKPGPALTPFVEDALDEVEFTLGDETTKWGAVRARLGHPRPFPLHYVEIGNEDEFDRSGSYEGRYRQFHEAIKAKYPQLQLIATTPVKKFRPDIVDDHYYKRADEFFDLDKRYDTADRNGPKIFVGEWATREGSPTTNLGAALGDAAWMTSMERNSDLIIMSAYAPLFVNVNPGGMQWESDLIGYDVNRAYGSPSYHAQSMFAEYLGTQYLATDAQITGNRFFYSATGDASKGKIYLKLVNASSLPKPVQVSLEGAVSLGAAAELISLSGTNTAETNTIDDPKRIIPAKSVLKAGASFQHVVPAYSIQVIVLNAR